MVCACSVVLPTCHDEAPGGKNDHLSYADDFPGKIACAASLSVTAPGTFRGGINDFPPNCNPNHQTIVEFKGRSYFIYHHGAAPHGGSFRRSVGVDYLNYNPDGTINPIVQSTEGAGPAALEESSSE